MFDFRLVLKPNLTKTNVEMHEKRSKAVINRITIILNHLLQLKLINSFQQYAHTTILNFRSTILNRFCVVCLTPIYSVSIILCFNNSAL